MEDLHLYLLVLLSDLLLVVLEIEFVYLLLVMAPLSLVLELEKVLVMEQALPLVLELEKVLVMAPLSLVPVVLEPSLHIRWPVYRKYLRRFCLLAAPNRNVM